MNNENLNDIKSSVKKAGIDIDEMKKAASDGKIEDYLSKKLSTDTTNQLKNILSDKQATEKLLSTPQAKELIRKLTKGK